MLEVKCFMSQKDLHFSSSLGKVELGSRMATMRDMALYLFERMTKQSLRFPSFITMSLASLFYVRQSIRRRKYF